MFYTSGTIEMLTKKIKIVGILKPAGISYGRYFVSKIVWPTVRKNCSSNRQNLLKFEKAETLQTFWNH